DCTFAGNSSDDSGGAIYVTRNAGGSSTAFPLQVSHSTFEDNTAGLNGGAIYIGNGTGHALGASIESSSFTGNSATGAISGKGNALFLFGEQFKVIDCEIENNVALPGGNGISVQGNTSVASTLEIKD